MGTDGPCATRGLTAREPVGTDDPYVTRGTDGGLTACEPVGSACWLWPSTAHRRHRHTGESIAANTRAWASVSLGSLPCLSLRARSYKWTIMSLVPLPPLAGGPRSRSDAESAVILRAVDAFNGRLFRFARCNCTALHVQA
jgi:hypothetical protein